MVGEGGRKGNFIIIIIIFPSPFGKRRMAASSKSAELTFLY